jgi:hypothetical protein
MTGKPPPVGRLPPVVRDKLAKLVPMLSSDRDGERIGAVSAIDRVLKSANLDWHDLAAQITAGPVQEQPQEQPQPQSGPQGHVLDEMDSYDLVDLIESIRESGAEFNERAEGFLNSLLGRASRYDAVFLSPKQKSWLFSLALKAGVEPP